MQTKKILLVSLFSLAIPVSSHAQVIPHIPDTTVLKCVDMCGVKQVAAQQEAERRYSVAYKALEAAVRKERPDLKDDPEILASILKDRLKDAEIERDIDYRTAKNDFQDCFSECYAPCETACQRTYEFDERIIFGFQIDEGRKIDVEYHSQIANLKERDLPETLFILEKTEIDDWYKERQITVTAGYAEELRQADIDLAVCKALCGCQVKKNAEEDIDVMSALSLKTRSSASVTQSFGTPTASTPTPVAAAVAPTAAVSTVVTPTATLTSSAAVAIQPTGLNAPKAAAPAAAVVAIPSRAMAY